MDTNNEQFSIVLKELDKTIKTIGIERLLVVLKNSRNIQGNISEENIDKALKIIELTCDEFNISLNQFFGTKRNNNRRFAIGVCANLIESFLDFNNTDISFILRKSDSLMSIYRNEINRLNENHPYDLIIIKKIENIKLKFKEYYNG
jgi:hypothetical protein